MTKRETALGYMKTAGYHGDQKKWAELYVEARVSYGLALGAYRAGIAAKAAGVRCNCWECA